MRPIVASLCLLLFATPGLAQTSISQEIGALGISATAARLEALPNPTDEERFALGGLHFLGAVEGAFQLRWRHGLTERMAQMLPFLRSELADNPSPEAIDPAIVATLFRDVAVKMEAARLPLAEVTPGSDFGLKIDLADLWFDINANARREPGEDMLEVLGPLLLGPSFEGRDRTAPVPVIRFDLADAAWLTAYTHVLQAVSEVVVAYDPTTAIGEAMATDRAMRASGPSPDSFGEDEFGEFIDLATIVLRALDQDPDAALLRSAHGHFLAMVSENRRFWQLVAEESDDAAEWVPNARQKSALGISMPSETGEVWLGVLGEFEAMMTGKLLVSHWRFGPGAGVNVSRMFTEPRPIDLVSWIQGVGAVPYLEAGPHLRGEAFWEFTALMGGQVVLFSLFLN